MGDLADKTEKLPAGISAVASQNVDSVDYFNALSKDEKEDVATSLHKITQNKENANTSLTGNET